MKHVVTRWQCTCSKCKHTWVSRSENVPTVCPSRECGATNWDSDSPVPGDPQHYHDSGRQVVYGVSEIPTPTTMVVKSMPENVRSGVETMLVKLNEPARSHYCSNNIRPQPVEFTPISDEEFFAKTGIHLDECPKGLKYILGNQEEK